MPRTEVTPAECAELRRAAKRGVRFRDLADAYRFDVTIVKRHVRGLCAHEIDEPEAPFE